MTPVLLSGPAVEPLSLAEAKNWLRVDHTEDDTLILALVTSARLVIEAHAQLLLLQQTWRLVLDRWPGSGPFRLPLRPIMSLDAIRVTDSAAQSQAVAEQDYRFSGVPLAPRLGFLQPPPAPGPAMAGIEIDLTAGFGPAVSDLLAELVQAMRLLVGHWYEDRGDIPQRVQTLPSDANTLIAPWRPVRLS